MFSSASVAGDLNKNEYSSISLDLIKLRRFNHPSNCLSMDISTELSKTTVSIINFVFINSESKAEIFLEDRLIALDRDNSYSRESYRGPSIELDDLKVNRYVKYSVDFDQQLFVEEDASIGCKNYPWGPHQNYNDCDETYMEKFISENYPPELRPIFMCKDETKATSTPAVLNDTDLRYQYFNGYTRNTCPLPCTRTSISASLINSAPYFDPSYPDMSFIELILPQKIMVTTTFYPNFSLVELLSSLGGSVGLWLGLGVLQLLHTLANLLPYFWSVVKRGVTAQDDLGRWQQCVSH